MNKTRAILVIAALTFAMPGFADNLRVVLKGYDPVAYFTEGKAVKGSPSLKVDWDDGRYHFASARHREMFAADPDRYTPQFAGYCTGSMSRGARNEAHPEAWVIVDGRLFLFAAKDSAAALKSKEMAEKDLAGFRVKVVAATGNWQAKK